MLVRNIELTENECELLLVVIASIKNGGCPTVLSVPLDAIAAKLTEDELGLDVFDLVYV